MANIYPVDYETPLGQLRALLFQTERYVDPANPSADADYLVPDGQLNAYLAINTGRLYAAASDALIALATNEALVSKKIRTEGGLQTDGPAVAQRLNDLAKEYRSRQRDIDDEANALDAFEIVPFSRERRTVVPPVSGIFHPRWIYHHRPVANSGLLARVLIERVLSVGEWDPRTGLMEETRESIYLGPAQIQKVAFPTNRDFR